MLLEGREKDREKKDGEKKEELKMAKKPSREEMKETFILLSEKEEILKTQGRKRGKEVREKKEVHNMT